MKRIYLAIPIVIAAVLAFSTKASGVKPDFQAGEVKNPVTGDPKKTGALPSTAIEMAPNIYYLGSSNDRDGRQVEGYAFIHRYNKLGNYAKPPKSPDSCYTFLSRGAKWRVLEPWIVNPANTRGLEADFIAGNLGSDVGKWETAATKDILGEGAAIADVLVADTQSPDGNNEVYFADVDSPGAIAVSIIWGIFAGPPQTRELVEWDQVYDDTDYDWSSTGEATKMDFENIATHELGHSVGLGDLYQSACAEQTMYGYAGFGETKKQTLEAGDIAGAVKLYQ